jgi:ribonuclease PH
MLDDCKIPIWKNTTLPISAPNIVLDPKNINFELEIIANANGSAYATDGISKVICSVHGPITNAKLGDDLITTGLIECECKFTAFAEVETSIRSNLESEYATIIKSSLESSVVLSHYPKCVISVNIMILECGSNCLALALSCASLAVCEAAIEQYDLLSAYSVSFDSSNGLWSSFNTLTIVEMTELHQIAQYHLRGRLAHEKLSRIEATCLACCKIVREKMDSQLMMKRKT